MALEDTAGRGVLTSYGPRPTNETNGGKLGSKGRIKQITYKFSYDDLPGGGTDALRAFVPAGAVIVDAYIIPTTDFAGGTSYDIGLEQSDGSTAIDADGLFDALVLADLDATPGSSVTAAEHAGTNSGVLIGQKLLVDGYLLVAATGTFTAGVAVFMIEYVEV